MERIYCHREHALVYRQLHFQGMYVVVSKFSPLSHFLRNVVQDKPRMAGMPHHESTLGAPLRKEVYIYIVFYSFFIIVHC